MQAVEEWGAKLKAAGRRVLVVQGTEELVVDPHMPEILANVLGACDDMLVAGAGLWRSAYGRWHASGRRMPQATPPAACHKANSRSVPAVELWLWRLANGRGCSVP